MKNAVFFSKLFSAIILFLSCLSVWADPLYTTDRVYEYGFGIPAENSYFVQVMGGDTRSAAEVRFECVRKTQPFLSVGIFEVATVDGVRPRFPFTIATASYVSKIEADAALVEIKKAFDYAKVAKCLGIQQQNIKDAIDLFRKDTFIFNLKVSPSRWQKSIMRSPIAPFDGIGEIRVRRDDARRTALVDGKPYSTQQGIASALASYRGRFKDVHFVAIQHGSFYFVSVTSLVGDEGLKRATQAMRRQGAYSLTATATFKPFETNIIRPANVDLVDIRGMKLPDLPSTTQLGGRVETLVLESEDIFESLPARVKRCYGGPEIAQASKLLELASCSGVVLTPTTLTRCLLESDCQGKRVSIGYKVPEVDLVKNCIAQSVNGRDPGVACLPTRIDPVFLSILDKSGLRACFDAGGLSLPTCTEARRVIANLCTSSSTELWCTQGAAVVAELNQRIDALLECYQSERCSSLVPRTSAVASQIALEAERLGLKLDDSILLASDALGVLADKTKVVDRFKECITKKNAGQKDDADACFARLALKPNELITYDCVRAAGNDNAAQIACFAPVDSQIGKAIETAKCAAEAREDIQKLAICAGGDAAKLTAAYACASSAQSATEAATNCLGVIPPDIAKGIECASKAAGAGGYVQCLPNLPESVKAAACLANADTDSAKLGCITANLPIDPKLAAAMGCIASASGNSVAMATCVASPLLPPEIAKAAACAADSTGPTDFALCAAGSGLNPELRIAAECAVSTGGAPPAFAICAAGRLTVRELGKCLSGEIGKEGGCFGPNNDIVKAFRNQVNDLLYGPGENNDIRKALGAITEPLKELGGSVSAALQKFGDAAKRGDIGRTICNWFGC